MTNIVVEFRLLNTPTVPVTTQNCRLEERERNLLITRDRIKSKKKMLLWENIADWLTGNSPEEVRAHYEALVHDVLEIDSCRVTRTSRRWVGRLSRLDLILQEQARQGREEKGDSLASVTAVAERPLSNENQDLRCL